MTQRKQISSRNRRGIALLLVVGMSIVIFPMVGLSIDTGILYVVRTKLSAASDAAALAGARSLSRGADLASQTTSAQTTASNYFRANFPDGFLLSTSSSITTTVSVTGGNLRTVLSNATASVPVFFMRMLGNTGPTVTVNETATAVRRDSNVVLVIDRSGSLQNSGSCIPMKAAATGFVDKFAEQRDFLGLVTFASSSFYMDYPVATNFKSSAPNITGIINNITCVGATSSAMGLWNGYTALAQLNQPGALNVIVFFTDGQPTGITANFPLKAASTCPAASKPPYPPNTPLLGVLSEGGGSPYGLMNLTNGAVPIANDNILMAAAQGASGCAFSPSSPNSVTTDVNYIPNSDYYGDTINSGYQSITVASGNITTTGTNIDNGSTNATDEAARHIRNGDAITAVTPGAPVAAIGKSMAGTVIFSIGLGNAASPPNADFLKRVANDPGASNYNASLKPGLYIFAQTASDLDDAFQRVAAEILRLAK